MKLIKDVKGDFVVADKIISFFVTEISSSEFEVRVFTVESKATTLKVFKSEAEARAWLNEFVIQFDDKVKNRELVHDTFGTLSQLLKKA